MELPTPALRKINCILMIFLSSLHLILIIIIIITFINVNFNTINFIIISIKKVTFLCFNELQLIQPQLEAVSSAQRETILEIGNYKAVGKYAPEFLLGRLQYLQDRKIQLENDFFAMAHYPVGNGVPPEV